jgi:hypothetical protein
VDNNLLKPMVMAAMKLAQKPGKKKATVAAKVKVKAKHG